MSPILNYDLWTRDAVRGVVPPPPGVTPNFDHPVSRRRVHAVTAIASPLVAGPFFLLRMYSRIWITRTFGWDDFTCVIAMLLSIGDGVAEHRLSKFGTGIHKWDVPYDTYYPNFPEMRLVTFSIYVFFMYFVKLSILLLYLRVFTTSKSFRLLTWTTIMVVTAYSLAGFIGTIVRCNPSKGACNNVTQLSIFSSVLNILTDLAILILPLRQVWRLHADTKQKISLFVVFATGSFVCIVSIIRLDIYIQALKSDDDTWHVLDGSIWTIIEANVGLICACLPALKALFQHHVPSLFGRMYAYPKLSKFSEPRSSVADRERHDSEVELKEAGVPSNGISVTTEVLLESKPPKVLLK